jgi:transglutaminase-like putative cysteine protease
MRRTWYFTRRTRHRVNSFARLALMMGLALTGVLAFAGTPNWLQQAAQTVLPTYPDDPDAVVLLDERLTTISPGGEVRTTYRRAYKILRPAGRTRGIVTVYFDNETQLTFLKAWSITTRNEEYEVKERDAVETAAFSESLYADTRYKLLQIPGVQPGSVIGYEYQQRQRPFVLQTLWFFQREIPVRRARFTLEMPSGWRYSTYWRNHAAVNPQQTGDNRWTWELADIASVPSEPEMPTWRSVAGTLGISFASTGSFSSWAEIGRWYAQLTSRANESTPPIRDKVRELVAGAADPIEKLRRLSSYVQHGIRYVAIEIGIGGYQPHAASDVMTSGYGDCKDKATLLKTMLREVGIDSYYVLINSDRDYLAADFPTPLDFNHVILAIRLPVDGVMPDAYAALRHDKLGKLLVFDPTDGSTPLGYLPPSLQSNRGLLVTDAGGELLTLPLLPPSVNRVLRVATLTLDKTGALKGTIEETHTGPSAIEMRERLRNLPKSQRQRVFQHILTALIDGAVLTSASMSGLNDSSAALSLNYDFTARAYAQRAGNLFFFRASALGRKARTLLEGKPRKQPIEFAHTASEKDVVNISLPADYVPDETPEAVKYEHPFATYESEIRVTEHLLHYSRSYELKDVRIPVERLEDLRTFFREISDDERAYTIMKAP